MYDTRARRNLFFVYLVFIGITTVLWLLSKSSLNFIARFPNIALAQILGLTAASLISLNLLLSARLKFFENLFGGLDKVYKQHQLTGKIVFALILAHPIFLLFGRAGLERLIKIYLLDFGEVAYNYGKFAVLGFFILISLTIFIKLPYHIWRRTHQFMIVPVIFVNLHVITISSDVSTFLPLKVWILGLLQVGVLFYIYKVILYPFIGPKFEYKIKRVNVRGLITEIVLSPQKKPLFFEPGQFVFAVFNSKNVTTEEHPFSISSSPHQNEIRLSIKKSGDFTSTLPELKSGDIVKLYGPYGQFGRRALSSKKEVLMIAGGIGVTPFLSLTNYIKNKSIELNYKIIYSYKNDTESIYKEELVELCGDKLITHHSDKNGHLTGKVIQEKVGPIQNKLIFLCGPKNMMLSLTKQFLDMGVKRRNIIFEDFDLKG